MDFVIKNCVAILQDSQQKTNILIEDKRISKLGNVSAKMKVDAEGFYALPGLIDIHIHGCKGVDFSNADPDEIIKAGNYLVKHGVTTFIPAFMSLPKARIINALKSIVHAKDRMIAKVPGIYFEGPFINPRWRGAHNLRYIKKPSINWIKEVFQHARDFIKILAVAPEIKGITKVIRNIKKQNVTISAGHSDATFKDLQNVDTRLITHIFNAMRRFHHREDGIIHRALLDDRIYCEAILDLRHISIESFLILYRCKGPEKIILISDGIKTMGIKSKTSNRKLVGGTSPLLHILKNVVKHAKIPLVEAIKMSSTNPARLLGLECGVLTEGARADIVLTDKNLDVKKVFIDGVLVYESGGKKGL